MTVSNVAYATYSSIKHRQFLTNCNKKLAFKHFI